jgi:NAD(P)-dependent dehydrogenase (short-subunit alcohol dehydrogenase family)
MGDNDQDSAAVGTTCGEQSNIIAEVAKEISAQGAVGNEAASAYKPRRKLHPSQKSMKTTKRKKTKMSLPLYALAGAFFCAYILPKVFYGFGFGSGSGGGGMGGKRGSSFKRFPVCREGTVIITDAAYGYARETALLLADQGLHVLAGVRNEVEEKSFFYDKRKGLEPFVLDISEPNQIAKLFYRLKFVTAEFERPLFGIIINTADSVLQSDGASNSRNLVIGGKVGAKNEDGEVSFNSTHLQLVNNMFDVPELDDSYRWYLKGSVRIIQAALDVFTKAQAAHENTLKSESIESSIKIQKIKQAKLCEAGSDTGEECKATADEISDSDNDNDKKDEDEVIPDKADSKQKKKKYIPSNIDEQDKKLCKAGATSRLLFMNFDDQGAKKSLARSKARLENAENIDNNKKQKKDAYRKKEIEAERALSNYDNDKISKLMKASLVEYISQISDALRHSNIFVSEIAVNSKAYRSADSRNGNIKKATELPELAAKELFDVERRWDLDLSKSTSESESDSSKKEIEVEEKPKFQSRKAKKRGKGSLTSKVIIDPKYSLEANQAAHALLSSFPKTVYDAHNKQARAKFLGL